jgi:hypothetical protein
VGAIDWEVIWQVERDICFLYHELAESPGIMGDVAYGSLYTLPYWEFLDVRTEGLPEPERRFIRDGCLVMLLAMAWDMIDRSGTYLAPYLERCHRAVAELQAEDAKTQDLVRTVTLALETARSGQHAGRELEELSVWANREYVAGYFRDMAAATTAAHASVPGSPGPHQGSGGSW